MANIYSQQTWTMLERASQIPRQTRLQSNNIISLNFISHNFLIVITFYAKKKKCVKWLERLLVVSKELISDFIAENHYLQGYRSISRGIYSLS